MHNFSNGIKDDKLVQVLLTVTGSTMYALLSNLASPDKPKEKFFQQLAEVLRRHFDPKLLVIKERFHFHWRKQTSGESINNYVVELRPTGNSLRFRRLLEQALRDWLA